MSYSKNIDKCGKNPQSTRRKPNYHTKCGKNCHKILSVYSTSKKWFQRFKSGNLDLEDEERQPQKVKDKVLEKFLEEVTRQAICKLQMQNFIKQVEN